MLGTSETMRGSGPARGCARPAQSVRSPVTRPGLRVPLRFLSRASRASPACLPPRPANWSLAGDGQKFVDRSWPAHAPSSIPPEHRLIGSGFEGEVRSDGLDGRQRTRKGLEFQCIGERTEPSQRRRVPQPAGVLDEGFRAEPGRGRSERFGQQPRAHRQAAAASRHPGRRDADRRDRNVLPRNPSHNERFGWFDHHMKGTAGKRPWCAPGGHLRLEWSVRGGDTRSCSERGASIGRPGEPCRSALRRRTARHPPPRPAYRARPVDAPRSGPRRTRSMRPAFSHPPEEVRGGCLRLPETHLRVLEGECRTAIGDQLGLRAPSLDVVKKST